ncbi:MAG TPA: DNA primase, partial [Phycisphaerales bacterium]|nr:DNA primase [Phycisphaerales bacterium]
MSRYSDHSEIDQVRNAVNLVQIIGEHVQLRPKGREHVGLCPFHPDKNPSLAVVTHKGSAFYKCHSCGAGGDVFDFIMNYHRMDFPEALKYLANRAGITLTPRSSFSSDSPATSKRSEIRKANALAAEFFRRALRDSPAAQAHRDIIDQRGISQAMAGAFMLGAAVDQWDALASYITKRNLPVEAFLSAGLLKPGRDGAQPYDSFRNRIIFPITDELGHPIAFGARKINPEDEPKYLNSAESAVFSKSRTLFGLNHAKRTIIDSHAAIIVEGYTDVIACHQAGFTNVVGTLGTALTADHAAILQRLGETVILVFDGDAAGIRAADRALHVLFSLPIDIRICVLPDELDPDELLKLPDGSARFAAALDSAGEALEYRVTRLAHELKSVDGLAARYNRVKTFLADLVEMGFHSLQGSRRTMVLTRLADLLGVPVADIQRDLPRPRRAAPAVSASSPSAPVTTSEIDLPVSRARR